MFQIGKVSHFAYPDSIPRLWSWYSCDRQVAILPEPGPGAVTTTRLRLVSTYSLAPYPSSETMRSTSEG